MKSVLFSTLLNNPPQSGDFFDLILRASAVGQVVLLILVVFSVVSWAVIIFKLVEYRRARDNSEKFLKFFRKTKNFSEVNQVAVKAENNPMAAIFRLGFRELSYQLTRSESTGEVQTEKLNRSLTRASYSEITRLERLNGFLATTASVTPFIGLFGTVWGIMISFEEIGIQMNANLATVAPGIAEALINTALGLFAAIPAVIFYNLLLNKLKVIISSMEDFILEFIGLSEKLK